MSAEGAENTFFELWSPKEGAHEGRPYVGCGGAAFGTN